VPASASAEIGDAHLHKSLVNPEETVIEWVSKAVAFSVRAVDMMNSLVVTS